MQEQRTTMITTSRIPLLLSLLVLLSSSSCDADTIQLGNTTICISSTNTYTAKVNLFAGEWGYYMFEECCDVIHPTIGLVVGVTYTFIQNDRSNWMHPLGFGYASDMNGNATAMTMMSSSSSGMSNMNMNNSNNMKTRASDMSNMNMSNMNMNSSNGNDTSKMNMNNSQSNGMSNMNMNSTNSSNMSNMNMHSSNSHGNDHNNVTGSADMSDMNMDASALLLPSTTHTGSHCMNNFSCPHPRYYVNDTFLGNVTTNPNDIGLNMLQDSYLPRFERSIVEWSGMGNFTITLQFDDIQYHQDLFYFCHIHSNMAGRIKLIDPNTMTPINEVDTPDLGFDYDVLGEWDTKCGTYGIDNSTLPDALCPSTFVCNATNPNNTTTMVVDANMQLAIDCYDAINCQMISGMTTGYDTGIPTVLFIHQMIPHHQNAVNMAKNLLRRADDILYCDDLTSTDDQNCIIQSLLRGMINSQNKQIQQMRAYLRYYNYPTYDECKVYVDTLGVTTTTNNN